MCSYCCCPTLHCYCSSPRCCHSTSSGSRHRSSGQQGGCTWCLWKQLGQWAMVASVPLYFLMHSSVKCALPHTSHLTAKRQWPCRLYYWHL